VRLGRSAYTLAAAIALTAAAAGPAWGAVPHRHLVDVLYVYDHNGRDAPSDLALAAYTHPFERILGGCTTGPGALTMVAIDVSDHASEGGGRLVTTLQTLKAIARRITWQGPRPCGFVYDDAEAHLESGQP
jgi:hypothetical protein